MSTEGCDKIIDFIIVFVRSNIQNQTLRSRWVMTAARVRNDIAADSIICYKS
jgi:hypothetical protein